MRNAGTPFTPHVATWLVSSRRSVGKSFGLIPIPSATCYNQGREGVAVASFTAATDAFFLRHGRCRPCVPLDG